MTFVHGPLILPFNTITWIYLILRLMFQWIGTVSDLILTVGQCDYISWSRDFASYFNYYFMDLHHTWVNGLDWHSNDLILVEGQCDLYFIVQ